MTAAAPTQAPPRLWVPEELAEYLGIPLATLYAWRTRWLGLGL